MMVRLLPYCLLPAFFLLGLFPPIWGQRLLNEGRITYRIRVADSAQYTQTYQTLFQGASLDVWLRGSRARVDFTNSLLTQSVFYDRETGTGVLTRVSGSGKFLFELNALQWKHFITRQQFTDWQQTAGDTMHTIGGYNCVRIKRISTAGAGWELWFTRQVLPAWHDFDPRFAVAEGLPVQFTEIWEGIPLIFSLSQIQFLPVPAPLFVPERVGYKLLPYTAEQAPLH